MSAILSDSEEPVLEVRLRAEGDCSAALKVRESQAILRSQEWMQCAGRWICAAIPLSRFAGASGHGHSLNISIRSVISCHPRTGLHSLQI